MKKPQKLEKSPRNALRLKLRNLHRKIAAEVAPAIKARREAQEYCLDFSGSRWNLYNPENYGKRYGERELFTRRGWARIMREGGAA